MTTITALSDRFELVTVPRRHGVPSFAQDVAKGLQAKPKRLSSKYLYDAVGSALFDAITCLPEYYLTRAETEILSEWGWQMVRLLDAPVDFLELGSGSAVKTRLLIGEALRVQDDLRYSPIDISTEAIRVSSMALVEAFPTLWVRAYAGDYFDVLETVQVRSKRKMLAMLMGSNIGNYEPDEAKTLLGLLAGALRPRRRTLARRRFEEGSRDARAGLRRSRRRNGGIRSQPHRAASIASSTPISIRGSSFTSPGTTRCAARSTRS